MVFATEYRPFRDTADGVQADLAFSRTGIARVGTARPKYLPDVRGFWSEDEDNPHGFSVIPVRFTAWLAAPVKGEDARVMRLNAPNAAEKERRFWIPVHKLFEGSECIQGLDLSLTCSTKFFNMKLQRAQNQAGHILKGAVYRVDACFIGDVDEDPSIESPKGPRFRLLPLKRRNFFFVTGEDSVGLRRREENPQWGRVAAE